MNKKAKVQTKTWIYLFLIVAGAIFLFGMYTQSNYPLFSILPAGQYNHNADCTFMTNTNFGTNGEDIGDYGSSGSWISIDWNGDGVKEGYGQTGSSSGSAEICARNSLGAITTTSAGLRIVKWSDTATAKEIGVCSSDGKIVIRYKSGNSNAANALLTCSNVCTENWNCTTWSTCNKCNTCSTATQTRTCNDLNNCGSIALKPALSQDCTVAQECTAGQAYCVSSNQYRLCMANNQWSGTVGCQLSIPNCVNGSNPICVANAAPQIYYRFGSNSCSQVSLLPSEVTANDYATLALCQVQITRVYYRLSNNACSIINLITSAKTSNDFENQTLCQAQITQIYYRFDDNTCTAVNIPQFAKLDTDYLTAADCQTHITGNQTENPVNYYRLSNNACSSVSLLLTQVTVNDYSTSALCEAKITTTNPTGFDFAKFFADYQWWIIGGVILIVALLLIKK